MLDLLHSIIYLVFGGLNGRLFLCFYLFPLLVMVVEIGMLCYNCSEHYVVYSFNVELILNGVLTRAHSFRKNIAVTQK